MYVPQHRQTYLGTQAHQTDLLLQIIEDLKDRQSTCQEILSAAKSESRIIIRPELLEIFLQNRDELIKLVLISLCPEIVSCRDPSWSYLATEILKKQPPQLMLKLIDPPNNDSHILFDFLQTQPNETSLGYFSELMGCIGNDFQDKVHSIQLKLLILLMTNKEVLRRCDDAAHHLQVFIVLFNTVIYSNETYKEFQAQLLKLLFQKVDHAKHYIEYSENVLQMMSNINENIGKLTQWVCSVIIQTLNERYIQKIIELIQQSYNSKNEYCENLLELLSQIIKTYMQIAAINEKQKQTPIVTYTIEKGVIKIIKSMGILDKILKTEVKTELPFSNGESVSTVGMLKYNVLRLMAQILKMPGKLVTAHFDIKKTNILCDLQEFITRNPWNNMVHEMVQEIIINIVDKFESYTESEESYIGPNGFLGFLIETFKNQKYMFLNRQHTLQCSCELSTYGYLHYLYNIAIAICSKLQQSENLRAVMTKFEPWHDFVIQDLQEYERNLDMVLGGPVNTIAKQISNEHSIRKIIVNLNQKQFSSLNVIDIEQKNQDLSFLDHFFEIIKSTSAFKKGRTTVLRQNSLDSPRKLSEQCFGIEQKMSHSFPMSPTFTRNPKKSFTHMIQSVKSNENVAEVQINIQPSQLITAEQSENITDKASNFEEPSIQKQRSISEIKPQSSKYESKDKS